MPRAHIVAFLIPIVLIGSAIAGEWWEEIPFTQWSAGQVYEILNDAPWVGLSVAGRRRAEGSSIFVPVFYRARLLTARPVREALLRMISLTPEFVITLQDLNKSTDADEEQSRLDSYILSNPNSILIEGDEEHIIVWLALRVGTRSIRSHGIDKQIWIEEPFGDELSDIEISDLAANTSLETNTGKRLALFDYIPAGSNRLGAMILFQRNLPDGTPFLAAGDGELWFRTRIKDVKVQIKFDLKEMMYKGKLET